MSRATVRGTFRMNDNTGGVTAHPLVHGTRRAGIEIELEGIPRIRNGLQYWELKGDGSLRDGGEFVSRGAQGGEDLFNGIDEIDSLLASASVRPTWRCSTHVHINARDLCGHQLRNVILAWAFYEKLMFRMSGIHRYRNNFCPAFGFAQSQIRNIANVWHETGRDFIHALAGCNSKYTSLNLAPLGQFGSIEFRISEPKYNRGQLLRLVNRFLALVEFASNFGGSNLEFVQTLIDTPVSDIFGKGLPSDTLQPSDDLEVGAKLCYDLLNMADALRRRREQEPVQEARLDGGIRERNWEELNQMLQRQIRRMNEERARRGEGVPIFPDIEAGEVGAVGVVDAAEVRGEWRAAPPPPRPADVGAGDRVGRPARRVAPRARPNVGIPPQNQFIVDEADFL